MKMVLMVVQCIILELVLRIRFFPILVCVLLCIYGAEVSQFLIITDTIVNAFSLSEKLY